MNLRDIAFGNLRRRKGKAFLITIGLTTAVAAFVLVLTLILSLRHTMDEQLSSYGANLLVTPPASDVTLSYGGATIEGAASGQVAYLGDTELQAIRALPPDQVVGVLPILLAPLEVEGRRFLGLGTELAQAEERKAWWKVEGRLPQKDNEVLLGLNVRNELGLETGESIRVAGQDFVVSGVLWETGDQEDNLILLDLPVLQELTGIQGRYHLIEVTAARSDAVEPLLAQMTRELPQAEVTALRHSIEFTNQSNKALADFGLAITALIVIVAGFVVATTMLMAVKERQKEIGIFRAVGYKQRHVASLVLIEAAALSAVAAGVGIALGAAGAWATPQLARGLSLVFVFDPLVLVYGTLLAFILGLTASLYPAWRAAGLEPSLALKRI